MAGLDDAHNDEIYLTDGTTSNPFYAGGNRGLLTNNETGEDSSRNNSGFLEAGGCGKEGSNSSKQPSYISAAIIGGVIGYALNAAFNIAATAVTGRVSNSPIVLLGCGLAGGCASVLTLTNKDSSSETKVLAFAVGFVGGAAGSFTCQQSFAIGTYDCYDPDFHQYSVNHPNDCITCYVAPKPAP